MRALPAILGTGLAVVVVGGTIFFMERARMAPVEQPAALKTLVETPAPPPPPAATPDRPRYQVGGAAAGEGMMVMRADADAPTMPAARPAPPPALEQPVAPAREVVIADLQPGEFPWGRPATAREGMRVVEMNIMEIHDGRMLFDTAGIQARVGEEIRIVFHNTGDFPHTLVLASQPEVARYIAQVQGDRSFWKDEPNWLYIAPGDKGEIVWRFTRAGQFEYSALVSAERSAGLVGRVVVR